MRNIDKQIITISNNSFDIPSYYGQIEALPDDPPGSVVYVTETPFAQCFFIGFEIDPSQQIPMNKEDLICGIRYFLDENQGIIEVEANEKYAYSIVKILNKPAGVQYRLTFQERIGTKFISINGAFEECGVTGKRDATVFALLKQQNLIGSNENPFEGWAKDPYDETYKTGALMNQSEQRQYDSMFLGSPLMMCRELIDMLVSGSNYR